MSTSSSQGKITSSVVTALRIPTDQQPETDGTADWDSTVVVLIELSAAGVTSLGLAYSAETAAHVLIKKELLGQDAFNIPGIHSAWTVQPATGDGQLGFVVLALKPYRKLSPVGLSSMWPGIRQNEDRP